MAFDAIAGEKRFDISCKAGRLGLGARRGTRRREQNNQDNFSHNLHKLYRLNMNSLPLSTAQNRSSRISRRVAFESLAASAMSVLNLFSS